MNHASADQGMPLSHRHRHRRQLLRLTLAFTAFFGAIFVVVNFLAERYRFTRWPRPQRRSWYSSWVMPISAHLLPGRGWGGLFSVFYLAVAGGLFLWRFGARVAVSPPGAIGNVLAVTVWIYMFSHFYEASREHAEHPLSQQALTDSLTGLANRARLEQAFQCAARQGALPLSVLMLDRDYFKHINDEHGHATGDTVLRQIAETLKEQTRPDDVVRGLGGEEFCVPLPRTDSGEARRMVERLRQAIEVMRCRHDEVVLTLMASIGVVSTATPGEQLEPMLHAADKKLYEAKFGGRNRVVC